MRVGASLRCADKGISADHVRFVQVWVHGAPGSITAGLSGNTSKVCPSQALGKVLKVKRMP
jgi:hypothetical protein